MAIVFQCLPLWAVSTLGLQWWWSPVLPGVLGAAATGAPLPPASCALWGTRRVSPALLRAPDTPPRACNPHRREELLGNTQKNYHNQYVPYTIMLDEIIVPKLRFCIADCRISPSVHINMFSTKISFWVKGFRWLKNHRFLHFLPVIPFRFYYSFIVLLNDAVFQLNWYWSALVCSALDYLSFRHQKLMTSVIAQCIL